MNDTDSITITQEEYERLIADKARLDFLESHSEHGLGWIARASTTGRGYRLHQERDTYLTISARTAIDEENDKS